MESQFGEFPDAIARRPMEALIGLEGDVGAFEPEPVDETAREALGLAEAVELINDGAVEQPEVSRVGDDLRIGDLIEQPVEDFPSYNFYPGVAPAFFPDTDDHLESFLPFPDELRNEFGRVLEIGVEHYTGIPRAKIDTGSRRYFLAEIS